MGLCPSLPLAFVCVADETSYEAGVKVQIHSQTEPPSIDQLGFGVAPGFQTFVSCQQQRVSVRPASVFRPLWTVACSWLTLL